MTEFEIYSLQASSFINNAMFQVCVVISVFIAFRLARVTNEMGAGMAMKLALGLSTEAGAAVTTSIHGTGLQPYTKITCG